MLPIRKMINDPIYGFITIDHSLIFQIISPPYYQRLRNIHQMAFAHLVYPGAVHSRLHHSLGAYHLMCNALNELKSKGTEITQQEELGAKAAILLHDIGHGPFSHALENELIPGVSHEKISLIIMQQLNIEMKGQLDTAIEIFTGKYKKIFLQQLVSGQLDVDRMDYLSRDSFFTGVAEGVIGYDRILKMMVVKNGSLMIEEKGRYSVEKFLVARRLMYWQVYLHKAVVGAEKMLVKIIRRARELIENGEKITAASPAFDFFLNAKADVEVVSNNLELFCLLDDNDVLCTIKNWSRHSDKILSLLCRSLVERKLFKVRLQSEPFHESEVNEMKKEVCKKLGISEIECDYLVFTGEASNTTYNSGDEKINILFKDGSIKDISEVDNALIHQHHSGHAIGEIKKYYLCYLKSS